MGVLAIGYSVPRFFLDFFRARDLAFVDGRVLGLTPAQWITPLLAAAGIYLLMRARSMPPASVAAASVTPGPAEKGPERPGAINATGAAPPEAQPDPRHAPSAR